MKNSDCNGYCICVHCNTRKPHTNGKACRENICPKCEKKMMREGSYHHQLYLSKKEKNHESCNTDKGKSC